MLKSGKLSDYHLPSGCVNLDTYIERSWGRNDGRPWWDRIKCVKYIKGPSQIKWDIRCPDGVQNGTSCTTEDVLE